MERGRRCIWSDIALRSSATADVDVLMSNLGHCNGNFVEMDAHSNESKDCSFFTYGNKYPKLISYLTCLLIIFLSFTTNIICATPSHPLLFTKAIQSFVHPSNVISILRRPTNIHRTTPTFYPPCHSGSRKMSGATRWPTGRAFAGLRRASHTPTSMEHGSSGRALALTRVVPKYQAFCCTLCANS